MIWYKISCVFSGVLKSLILNVENVETSVLKAFSNFGLSNTDLPTSPINIRLTNTSSSKRLHTSNFEKCFHFLAPIFHFSFSKFGFEPINHTGISFIQSGVNFRFFVGYLTLRPKTMWIQHKTKPLSRFSLNFSKIRFIIFFQFFSCFWK